MENKNYSFNIDFNELIEDLWQTALCKYLNTNQYEFFIDSYQKLEKQFNAVMNEIQQKALRNTLKYMEQELEREVKIFHLQTLSDFDELLERMSSNIEEQCDWESYKNSEELRSFCDDYPDIAKKYLNIN